LVALTAFDPEEVERSDVDFDGVFAKPVDVTKLIAFLDGAVDRREKLWIESVGNEYERTTAISIDTEAESMIARIRAAIESGDAEELRSATRVLGSHFSRIGAPRLEAALRRLLLAFPDEEKVVLLSRAERLAREWGAASAKWRSGREIDG
ncbi:MAG: hypothetical protein Q8M76_12225, partial [Spirochaetaceae bacterium]|nr:hypothetical protein [Spirochaetaceae bacterium]